MTINPFMQRGRITDPRWFAGRFGELSLLFHAVEHRRPVFVVGSSGVGKSSFLTHLVQAAAINLERFDLRAFSLDLAVAASEADVYRVVIEALGKRGASASVLQDVLAEQDAPLMLCLDNGHAVLDTEWGVPLLDTLARLARSGLLMLVVALNGEAPILAERAVLVRLGAFAPAEIRLVCESYLEGTGVVFTPRNYHQLYRLSQGHPAYLQRAAFHLFEAHGRPGYDWIRSYLDEAQTQPVVGAPLPPLVFEGMESGTLFNAVAVEGEDGSYGPPPTVFQIESSPGALLYALPLLLGVLLLVATGNGWLALAVAAAGLLLVIFVQRRATG